MIQLSDEKKMVLRTFVEISSFFKNESLDESFILLQGYKE